MCYEGISPGALPPHLQTSEFASKARRARQRALNRELRASQGASARGLDPQTALLRQMSQRTHRHSARPGGGMGAHHVGLVQDAGRGGYGLQASGLAGLGGMGGGATSMGAVHAGLGLGGMGGVGAMGGVGGMGSMGG